MSKLQQQELLEEVSWKTELAVGGGFELILAFNNTSKHMSSNQAVLKPAAVTHPRPKIVLGERLS